MERIFIFSMGGKKKKKILFIFLSVITILAFVGCAKESSLENGHIKIVISKNFGKEQLHNDIVAVKESTNVMEIMKENYEIETAYGGSFVNAIDGLKSGFTGNKEKKSKIDWFYYINGILTHVGAEDYYLKSGDTVIWDYHDWSSSMYLSSIIGAYPSNFINGYEGNILKTEILSTDGYKTERKELFSFLKSRGLKYLEEASLYGREVEDDGVNSIVIGDFKELIENNYIKTIYEDGTRAGLFFKIGDNIKILDYQGNVSKEFKKGAVITSVLKNYGALGTLWIIMGNDDDSIKKAVSILYKSPEKIEGKFSVVVTGEEIINIPIN